MSEVKQEPDLRGEFAAEVKKLIDVKIMYSDKAYELIVPVEGTSDIRFDPKNVVRHVHTPYVVENADMASMVNLVVGLIRAESARNLGGKKVKMFLRSIDIDEEAGYLRCCVYQEDK